MDQLRDSKRKSGMLQDVIYMHQGFNYGDFGADDNRVPSFGELRNQNLMALILGAKGLFHYNRTEMQYPELYLGLPELVKELKMVGEQAIIHPDAPESVVSDHAALRTLAKLNDRGYYWILVCNASYKKADAKFKFLPCAGKELRVLSENRTVSVDGAGVIADSFSPWQVHVYTNQSDLPGLKTLAAINTEIEAAYAALKKTGNLAWQRFEGEVLNVKASSNKFSGTHADSTLWHLTDGFTEGEPAVSRHGYGILHYCDSTPDQFPDWVEYDFKQPQTIGRVVIYPVEDAVKDFQVQVWKNNAFVTVKEVKNFSGKMVGVTFSPVRTARLRLVVTAGRGSYTRIYEMEVYAK